MIYNFAIFWSCLHVKIAKLCSMFDKSFRLSYLITYVLKCFHQNIRSRIVSIDDVFFITLFDFQYFRTDFKMRFTSKCSIRNCFSYKTWWHVKQLHVKFSISSRCQCERDMSKVINFCFTIAHEICDNELIKSFMSLKSTMFQICEYVFVTIIASINWKTIALFNIKFFHSSMITFDASRISKKTKFSIEL